MKTRSIERPPRAWLGAAVLLALAGCTGEPNLTAPVPPAGRLALIESHGNGRVTAVVRYDGRTAAAGLQGRVRFNPAAARYVGQELDARAIMLVGETDLSAGVIRFVVLDRAGLGREAAVFAFERIQAGLDLGLELTVTHATTVEGVSLRPLVGRFRPVRADREGVPTAPRRMTVEDWYRHFNSPPDEQPRPELLPGQGTVYGDINLSGFVNLFDVIAVQNIAAGAQPLLTDVARDAVVAGDVAPANAPGLGEASDPIPPGLDASGNHELNVFDAIAIANFAAGVPELVAGQLIPGRTTITNRAVLTGQILADLTLSRDTIYELDGMVIVTNGAVLRIPAGTRIEGNSTTRGSLSVRRGSQILAAGTRLEPVIMTCTAAVKTPGCWGGLQINGAASVNHTTGGGFGCPELTAPGGFGIYGGCVNSSSSGGLEYVRIEYAGAPAGATPIAGLQLLGVGSGTLLENIQVHRAQGVGVFVSGGYAQVRRLMVTDNGGVAFDWDGGWRGKAQQVVIHRGTVSGIGVRGSNAPPGTTVLGQPSMPMIYNLTVVGPSPAGAGFPALLLYHGTQGVLRNVLIQGFDGAGLEINDAETCTAVTGGMLAVADGIFYQNTPNFSTDADCIDEVAYAQTAANALSVVDPQLLAPNFAASPDFRTAFGSPAGNGTVPPGDGFFDPDATYLGAVPPANVTTANIPWYAGWTVGWG